MNIYVKKFGKLFLGLAILVVSIFPLIMGASFFMLECDFQEWTGKFTDPQGLPMSEGLMIAIIAVVTLVFLAIVIYGFYLVASAAQTSGEELGNQILDAMKRYVKERQEQCPHDFVHQVGFTNMLKCDECGLTFENKHFVSE